MLPLYKQSEKSAGSLRGYGSEAKAESGLSKPARSASTSENHQDFRLCRAVPVANEANSLRKRQPLFGF